MAERRFSGSKRERDALFSEKDDVTLPLLSTVLMPDPSRFYAVLMPSLYGPEVFHLQERGVPAENLFAVERDPDVHAVLRNPPDDLHHLQHIRTTKRPLPLHKAVERIPFDHVSLAYFDLFGQPDANHLKALFRLFRLYPMRPSGRLLLTAGRNRGEVFSCRLNARLVAPSVGQAYIEAALEESGHRWPEAIRNHQYISNNIHFTITEVLF